MNRPAVVAGIGSRFGVSVTELRSLLELALDRADLRAADLTALATVIERSDEPAITALAAELELPLLSFPATQLARIGVPKPSKRVLAATGTPSVAEAAALLGAGQGAVIEWTDLVPEPAAELLIGKLSSPRATLAIAGRTTIDLQHHGDAELAAGMLDLAVNVRSEPRPGWLDAAIADAVGQLSAYPNPDQATAAIASRHHRKAAEVLVTAGASEAFTLIAQGISAALPSRAGRSTGPQLAPIRTAVVVHPQFTEPEVALRVAGWQVERLILEAADGFALDPEQIPAHADLVVIGNPTNPTGTLHPASTIRSLVKRDRVVLVDEAFMDAVPGETESLADDGDLTGLLVARSLTKTWGLAGLRIGYLLGDSSVLNRIRRHQPRWSVSGPALAAALACMTDQAHDEQIARAESITKQRDRLSSALSDRGFDVPDAPYGPFLLTRHRDRPNVHAELRELGIAVRRADTFPGLGPGWVRVAVRDSDSADALLAALDTRLARDPAAGQQR